MAIANSKSHDTLCIVGGGTIHSVSCESGMIYNISCETKAFLLLNLAFF